MVYSNSSDLDPNSKSKIFLSVESCDEKTAENYQNCYVTDNRIVSNLTKISIPNFDSTNWKLKIVPKLYLSHYLLYFPWNKPTKNVMVESGRAGMHQIHRIPSPNALTVNIMLYNSIILLKSVSIFLLNDLFQNI